MNSLEQLIPTLESCAGFDAEAFSEAHLQPAPVSIRRNPAKPAALSFEFSGKVPWSNHGVYLDARPSFTLDPLFHGGAYYVQEASSMFVETAIRQLVDLSKDLNALDLCAAPGGKSTLIQSLITAGSVLVSNEIHKSRVSILEENMIKWGSDNVVVTNSSPEQFGKLEELFDLVLVDAPCSGSGLFRKDPEAIKEWSLQNVAMCARRQQDILREVLPALAQGGTLIYSTCSYSREEDENIALWCIEQGLEPLRIETDASWNVVEAEVGQGVFGYRFYPDKLAGEGFFLSAFRKPGKVPDKKAGMHAKLPVINNREEALVRKWVDVGEVRFVKWQDEVLLMPERLYQLLPALQKVLYIKYAGLRLGELVREELVPDHALALSGRVASGVPVHELDLADALNYLRREEIKNRPQKAGWHLVTYKHLPMGWLKSLGNRVNNYYPKEWRVRMKS